MKKERMMTYSTGTQVKEKSENVEKVMVWVPKTRVILADDHDMVRKGIRNLLRRAADILVIGEATNGDEAIHLVNQLKPDVLLLDIEMPGMNGVDVIRRLGEAGIATNILVLSAYDDQEYILEMLGNGASGYLLKEETPEYILDAVRGVASGQKGWVSSQVAQKLDRIRQSRRMETTLTFRELDILRLLAEQKTDAQIASALESQELTISQALAFLMSKVQANSRTELVEIARRQHWI